MDEKKASQFLLQSVMSSNWLAATHTLVISSNLVHNMLGTKKGKKNQSNKVGKERKRERKGEFSKSIKEQQHYICCGCCWKVMLKVETLIWISISLLFVKNHFLLHLAMDGHHFRIIKNLTINQTPIENLNWWYYMKWTPHSGWNMQYG